MFAVDRVRSSEQLYSVREQFQSIAQKQANAEFVRLNLVVEYNFKKQLSCR